MKACGTPRGATVTPPANPATERSVLPLRQGRAIGWITEALEPLGDRLTEAETHRLVLAIRSATGIEALVWLTDVGGPSRADAAELIAGPRSRCFTLR